MVGGSGTTAGGGGGVSANDVQQMLYGMASEQWVNDNYLSIDFFNRLFTAHGTGDTVVKANDMESTITSIEAMFGFWTEEYISALGRGSGGGGGGSSISPIDESAITAETTFNRGDALAINGTVYRCTASGTDNMPLGIVVQDGTPVYQAYKNHRAWVIGDNALQEGWEVWLNSGLDFYIEWYGDRISQAERDIQALYNLVATGGGGGGGGGSLDPAIMWSLLSSGTSEQINISHLTGALNDYARQAWVQTYVGQQGFVTSSALASVLTDYATHAWVQSQGYLTEHQSLDGYATEQWVSANFNNYVLPVASSTARGGVKIGYTTSATNRNYAVQLWSEKMYVNVPWVDTNTWRDCIDNLTSTATDKSLSANMGRVLNETFANYLPLTGGTITGDLTVQGLLAAATRVKIGDIYIGYDSAHNALEVYKLDTDNTTHVSANFYALGGISALGYGPGGGGGGGVALNPVDESTITAATYFHQNDILAIDGTIYRCIQTTNNLPVSVVFQGNKVLYVENNGHRAYVINSYSLQSGWEVWLNSGLDYHISVLYDMATSNQRAVLDIERRIGTDGDLATKQWVQAQGYITQLPDLSPYATKTWVQNQGYLTQHQSLDEYATEQWVYANFNNYVLPVASATARGGVRIGYSGSGRNYPVELSSEKMYVYVPWTDTTYSFSNADATLAWSQRTKIATVGGTDIYVTMPANPDTNTWRPVVDNLSSSDANSSLSANQGRLLASGSARDNTKVAKAGDTMTGLLNVATGIGISDASGNALLCYKPTSWTGVANTQWGVGTIDVQGVIRSSNTALLHYRYGDSSYEIIDAKGGQSIAGSLQVANIYLGHTNEINGVNSGVLYLQARGTGNTYINANSGYCGIGVTSASYKLHVGGVIYSSVGVYSAGYVTALSDERHKRIEGRTGLEVEQIAQMPDVKFTWTDRNDPTQYVGTIAQKWQEILPQVVRTASDRDHTLSMDYQAAALISAIVTARRVCDHEARIRALERKCAALEQANAFLKNAYEELKLKIA